MNKVHLIILDGFGLGPHDSGDAVFNAKAPFIKSLFENNHYAKLKTHGSAVGLPEFQTGGSEAGHITIGAGRPVKQFLTKINDQIDSGAFFENPVLKDLFEKAKKQNRIHFMGLISDGGIHSFLPHLFGLQKMAEKYGIENVYIHAFTDGRDVGERTATQFVEQIEDQNIGKIATLGGRFFGMDRDNNWDRVEKAYEVMCRETDIFGGTPAEYTSKFYKEHEKSDYYTPPTSFDDGGKIREDDILVNFNYRSDRMVQLSQAFLDKDFDAFDQTVCLDGKNVGIFGKYSDIPQLVFESDEHGVVDTIGEIISKNEGTQLRISETEKFNHVTFFMSGERKDPFAGEERILIPSPKCASYAEKPEMSAAEQTEAVIEATDNKEFNLIVQNFANADLVGHSGSNEAAEKAVVCLDKCLEKLIPQALEKGYEIIITADHGNADEMFLPNGDPNASHTKNLVPCFVLGKDKNYQLAKEGTLADITPTILDLLGIDKPEVMTGNSVIQD